jgi:hypothetical protein
MEELGPAPGLSGTRGGLYAYYAVVTLTSALEKP